eukprot:m.168122 g.168122  ORF g.168122 m.168122 type:complete len:254 (-) comp53190_c0_seq3:892-1653(-)
MAAVNTTAAIGREDEDELEEQQEMHVGADEPFEDEDELEEDDYDEEDVEDEDLPPLQLLALTDSEQLLLGALHAADECGAIQVSSLPTAAGPLNNVLLRRLPEMVMSCAVNAEQHVAAIGSYDGFLRTFDTRTWTRIRTFRGRHYNGVRSICITRDAAHIVTGDDGGRFMVYDGQRGTLLRKIRAHFSTINAIQETSDGSCIVSASFDDYCRVWRLPDLALVTSYSHHQGSLFLMPLRDILLGSVMTAVLSCH